MDIVHRKHIFGLREQRKMSRFKIFFKLRRDSLISVEFFNMGTAVAHWLKCCATNRKFLVSIPASINGIFH